MRKILLPALLGLALTACSTNFAPMKYSMVLNVAGVPTATVIVTDTTTRQQVFNQPVSGTATVPDLTEDHVYTVSAQDINGYTTPATQTVTLKKNEAVSLIYTAR